MRKATVPEPKRRATPPAVVVRRCKRPRGLASACLHVLAPRAGDDDQGGLRGPSVPGSGGGGSGRAQWGPHGPLGLSPRGLLPTPSREEQLVTPVQTKSVNEREL